MSVTKPATACRRSAVQRGAAMMEVLISLLIVAFGILGVFGMQSQATVAQLESYQRAQALVLVRDMAQRIEANTAGANSYIGTGYGTTDPGNCALLIGTRQEKDLCEWTALLRGAAERYSTTNTVGAMIGAQGCISQPDAITRPNLYLVSVVWQGLRETGPTPITCGNGAYTSENLRRGASLLVQLPSLSS